MKFDLSLKQCVSEQRKKPYKTQNYRDMVMKIYIGDISGDILSIQRFIIHSHTKEIHNTASVFSNINIWSFIQ